MCQPAAGVSPLPSPVACRLSPVACRLSPVAALPTSQQQDTGSRVAVKVNYACEQAREIHRERRNQEVGQYERFGNARENISVGQGQEGRW